MHSLLKAGLLAATLGAAVCASAQTTAAGPYYVSPSWDQKLPAATRFVVLSNWNNDAVLDRETGLVWERGPLQARNFNFAQISYSSAVSLCVQSKTGGRYGWRLPSISELQSLVDPSATTDFMTLPPGHPFLEIQDDYYWSSTTTASSNGGSVFVQGFTTRHHDTGYEKTAQLAMWCVRGPGGGSVQ